MRTGLNRRVDPQRRRLAPTASFSRTVTSYPRAAAASAASSPTGPAPMTISPAAGHPLRSTELQACTQWAITPPPRMTAATLTASVISSGEMPASAQRRRVGVDAVGLLDGVGDGQRDELLGALVEGALLHRGRVPLHEEVVQLGVGAPHLAEPREVFGHVVAGHGTKDNAAASNSLPGILGARVVVRDVDQATASTGARPVSGKPPIPYGGRDSPAVDAPWGPKTSSASYWLCRRHRSEMFSTVSGPSLANGLTWWNSRKARWVHLLSVR